MQKVGFGGNILIIGGGTMKKIISKIIRKADNKNRIILPRETNKINKNNEYYVTLYDNGDIKLEPVKNGGK